MMWGDALKVQNRGVKGQAFAEARRKIVVPYLKGNKIALDHKTPVKVVPISVSKSPDLN
jgi:hypothetical protein